MAKRYSIATLAILGLALTLTSLSSLASSIEKFGCGGKMDKFSSPVYGVLAIEPGFENLTVAIAGDFANGDFKSLMDAAERWKAGDCALKNGEQQRDYFLAGFTKYFTSSKNWDATLKQVISFEAAFPEHPLPYIVESRYWSDYANNARGFGGASTVSSEGWKLFHERLHKSEEILVSKRKTLTGWPHWCLQMIRVESLLDASEDARSKLFKDCVEKHGDFRPIYTEMAYYSEPRWGGSWKRVKDIAEVAQQKISLETKDETYARMVLETGSLMSTDDSFFEETKSSWKKMKSGLKSLSKKHPESYYIKHSLAAYACRALDKNAYLEIREVINHGVSMTPVWGNGEQELCDAKFGYKSTAYGAKM